MHSLTVIIQQGCTFILLALLLACNPGGQGFPGPPNELHATAGNGMVTLNWSPNAGSSGNQYNIYWSEQPNVTLQEKNRLPRVNTPYIHQGLKNGQTYYYRVTSLSYVAESLPSQEVSATPQTPPPPSPPNKVTIVPLRNKTARLNWELVNDDNSYNIYIKIIILWDEK